MKSRTSFKGKTAVIVCHDSVFGPPHELRDYLLRHSISKLLFIGHVNRYLPNNPVPSSYVEYYEKGKLRVKKYAKPTQTSEIVAYLHDIFLTLYWFMKYLSGRSTYFVGLGNMNVIFGLIGKLFGSIKYVIYYVIDYSPKRFKNVVMNTIFQSLDYLCARYSSVTWNYSKSMLIARQDKWKTRFPRQEVVPNGITIKKNLPGYSMTNKHELVYIGTLVKQQGLMFVLQCLPELVKRMRDIHLTIIGMGEMRGEIERYCKTHDLYNRVKLVGYIPDPYEADKIVSRAALGVAMYIPNFGFVEYTEPGKIKRYLSCSVPAIMTPVSFIANDLEKYKCGFNCPYEAKAFINIVSSYLKNQKTIQTYRNNALKYAKRFEWERIFTNSFHLLHHGI